MNYVFLSVAIVFEVIATTALKQTEGFTRLLPSLVTVGGYALAFYFLSLPLRTMPVGIIYAIWSGAGIVILALARLAECSTTTPREVGPWTFRSFHKGYVEGGFETSSSSISYVGDAVFV